MEIPCGCCDCSLNCRPAPNRTYRIEYNSGARVETMEAEDIDDLEDRTADRCAEIGPGRGRTCRYGGETVPCATFKIYREGGKRSVLSDAAMFPEFDDY